MKRSPLLPVVLVVAALGLSFVALASPVAAAAPCVALGEYYTFAPQCAPRAMQDGWLALLLLQAAVVGGAIGLLSLRRHLRGLGGLAGRASRR